eukprot:6285399-Prymnesium_polylepis.1
MEVAHFFLIVRYRPTVCARDKHASGTRPPSPSTATRAPHRRRELPGAGHSTTHARSPARRSRACGALLSGGMRGDILGTRPTLPEASRSAGCRHQRARELSTS